MTRLTTAEANAYSAMVHSAVFAACNNAHRAAHAMTPGQPADGTPMVAGALAGVLDFAIRSGLDDAAIKADVNRLMGEILPQLRFAQVVTGDAKGRA